MTTKEKPTKTTITFIAKIEVEVSQVSTEFAEACGHERLWLVDYGKSQKYATDKDLIGMGVPSEVLKKLGIGGEA